MTWVNGHKLQNGKYTIEKKLGDGGFGITYLATTTNRQRVVIKTLNDTVQNRPDFNELQQDFLNEALRLAKCTHPHIVKIHEVVQEGRLWCMVMEYIDGEDLANRVSKQGVLPEAEALRYIQQIGEALTVVHQQGLLHRDVKPQNIMLRLHKGSLEAILIDFGIAREFTPDLTQTHTQYRTEFFAPIEQYDRRARRGAYTDVYALAATLYVILTGQLPEASPLRAAGTPLTPPKQHNSSISDKVNRGIIKGMAVKAKDRPQSVAEWLKLVGHSSQQSQWVGYIALIGSVVAIFIGFSRQPAPQKEKIGTPTRSPVEDKSPTPKKSLPPTPRILVSPSPTTSPERFILVNTLSRHSNAICVDDCISFSPDGQTFASGSFDRTVKLWDFRSGELKSTLTGHFSGLNSVAFSPDGTLASGSADNTIKLWDIPSGQLKTTLTGHSDQVLSVAFSPDGQTLASGSSDKTIKLWDVRSGQLKFTIIGHFNRVVSVAFSPDGQTLASGSEDTTIKLWDVRSGQLKTTLSGHTDSVFSICFSPDGQTLASGSPDKSIKLWDVRSGQLKTTLSGHSNYVNSVAFSPDSQTLASGSSDGTIKLWDVRYGELKTTLTGDSRSIYSVNFSPDGQTLVSGSSDGTIKIWRISSKSYIVK